MEASIEHLSRGTVRNVEVLLIVAEPYYRALETLGRIVPLAQELSIPKIMLVANKVRSERDFAAIQEYASRLGLDIASTIPFDEAVQEADRENRALIEYGPDSPAVRSIAEILDVLIADTGRSAPSLVAGQD